MAFVDRAFLGIAIVCAILISASFPTSIAYERPVHTIVLALSTCGFILVSLNRNLPTLFRPSPNEHSKGAIPLHELSPTPVSHKQSSGYEKDITTNPWRPRLIFVGAVLALSLRIEVYRRISLATECTVSSLEVFLPFLVATYDAFKFQHVINFENDTEIRSKTSGFGIAKLRWTILGHPARYVISALILSSGCRVVGALWKASSSTYICPLVGGQARTIPLLQLIALLLDAFLAVATVELSLSDHRLSSSPSKGPAIVASIAIAAATVWFIIGAVYFFAKPEYRAWLLPRDLLFSLSFSSALTAQVGLLSLLCISSYVCIIKRGLLYTMMLLTALCVMVPGLRFIYSTNSAFPPLSSAATASSFMLLYLGWWSFESSRQSLGLEKRRSFIRQVALLLILLIAIYPGWSRNFSLEIHPIEVLIRNAKVQHQQYLKGIRKSQSLQDAVVEYKRKYSMRPPPGFDVWYEYATNRSATIIDEFDQIYDDLLPFRLTSPADLRRQTWEMVSNPWNEISGITIRDGTAAVQANVLPTHRWMLEGVAILINSFARFLPDMDLAFNLNDESRIAVPFTDLSGLRKQARSVRFLGHGTWSGNRSETWLPIPEQEYTETVFHDMSFRNTFSAFGSIGCDPQSNARKNKHISSKSHICLSCISPHSEGQFISDWALAADVCHQPDLAHLHGFYLSPAAFKTSYQAMPVFSQSKPHGYNDILYPSAWNYMDKAIYAPSEPSGELGTDSYQPGFPDPDFDSKKNTLFWRGATSEGVSFGSHTWRGMTRQRLVHMANNLTSAQHDYATVLLPEKRGTGLKYQTIPGRSVKDLGLDIDIAIVDHIARCADLDCTDQEKEFALLPPSDFQAHWQYRYLFDLDGAGFSGRFLPFMSSKSLPFKTALFREWYDSRLTAWQHFVPQDLRLHGVWSTLAYFAGVNGTLHGRKVAMASHLKEGEEIANAGRNWAGKVLRKEDMELYFFRLLLEWGRLTDDNRDNLGFSI